MVLFSGVIFPEQFYTFLKNYMSKFAMLPVLTADEKISRYLVFSRVNVILYHSMRYDSNSVVQATLVQMEFYTLEDPFL